MSKYILAAILFFAFLIGCDSNKKPVAECEVTSEEETTANLLEESTDVDGDPESGEMSSQE